MCLKSMANSKKKKHQIFIYVNDPPTCSPCYCSLLRNSFDIIWVGCRPPFACCSFYCAAIEFPPCRATPTPTTHLTHAHPRTILGCMWKAVFSAWATRFFDASSLTFSVYDVFAVGKCIKLKAYFAEFSLCSIWHRIED